MSVYISGIGLTKIARNWGASLRDLAGKAAIKALSWSNIGKIDALYIGNMSSGIYNGQENLGSLIANYIGVNNIPAFKVEAACASGAAAFVQAYLSVKSGIFSNVLVVGVEKMTDLTDTEDVTSALATAADAEYEVFHGASFTALNAMIMQRYMYEYKVDNEVFGRFSVLMHENGAHNPYAQVRSRISLEKYFSSPFISKPIRLLDCSPIGDGAAAILLSSDEKYSLNVKVSGVGMATDSIQLFVRENPLRLTAAYLAVKDALKMANTSIEKIDVIETHDAFTIMGLLSLEEMGLAKKGKSSDLIEKEVIGVSGDKPVNPSGGLKSRGHPVGATGVYQIAEITLQLIGKFSGLQVKDAVRGLTLNIGGTASNCISTVLERC